jgi:hypothetical protein
VEEEEQEEEDKELFISFQKVLYCDMAMEDNSSMCATCSCNSNCSCSKSGA